MNPLNQWLKLEQMDEENPRFEEFMKAADLKDREQVTRYASLCAFKIYPNGACVRVNKQLISGQRQALNLLYFAGVNIDVLRFDDWFHTELNTMFLFELNTFSFKTPLCPHCFNLLTYSFSDKISHCSKCEYVLPS